jgi:hypothetical protein
MRIAGLVRITLYMTIHARSQNLRRLSPIVRAPTPRRFLSGCELCAAAGEVQTFRRTIGAVRRRADVGELTGQANIPLWMNALVEQSGTPYQTMALQVIARDTVAGFKSNGVELAGAEREALTGPLGMSGYSMLFERRGDRWVFLCFVLSLIS